MLIVFSEITPPPVVSVAGENAIKKRKEDMATFMDDSSRGGAAGTLYGREKGDDGRSLSSEHGASMRPTDTSAQWVDHAFEEPLQAEASTCSNCEEARELSLFFYGGGTRRVMVLDHMVGKHRCNKHANKPRGVFKPSDEKVKTITDDGLLKAVRREAKGVAKKASGGN
ncbi:unnamed protein product [Ectocarpus sp. CCAP 1310/34]|nr:unnamed protein product [Ectocarpus sp. CCAP 1310/34]